MFILYLVSFAIMLVGGVSFILLSKNKLNAWKSDIKSILMYSITFLLGIVPAYVIILASLYPDEMNRYDVASQILSLAVQAIVYFVFGFIFGYFGSKPHWKWSTVFIFSGLFVSLLINRGLILYGILHGVFTLTTYIGSYLGCKRQLIVD